MLYDDEYIARAITGQYQEYEGEGEIHLNPLQKILFYIPKSGMIVCYGIIFCPLLGAYLVLHT